MSDARTATWAAPLPRSPCSVLGARALFQLPPTSKHSRMGLPLWPRCLTTGTRACVPVPASSLCPNHIHGLLLEAPAAHNE